jgi:hypothetical protein
MASRSCRKIFPYQKEKEKGKIIIFYFKIQIVMFLREKLFPGKDSLQKPQEIFSFKETAL